MMLVRVQPGPPHGSVAQLAERLTPFIAPCSTHSLQMRAEEYRLSILKLENPDIHLLVRIFIFLLN